MILGEWCWVLSSQQGAPVTPAEAGLSLPRGRGSCFRRSFSTGRQVLTPPRPSRKASDELGDA